MISPQSKNFQKIKSRSFLVLLLLMIALSLYMMRAYISPVLWAAILASLFHPSYVKISTYFKNKNLGAGITTLLIVLIVLIPVSLIISSLVRELITAIDYLRDPATINKFTTFIESQRESELIRRYFVDFDVKSQLENILNTVGSSTLNFIRNSSLSAFSFFAKSFVMLYTLFFFLRDSDKFLTNFKRLLPFGDANERELYRRFTSTARATLKGSVLLAVIQGLIAGVGFLLVGFPSVAFFTILTIFFAIIPALGASVVIVSSAIYLFFTAPLWQALVLIGFAVFINLSENILRPKLVGDDVQMHPVLFVLATLGGISLFGLSGIVFGPVILAFLLSLLKIYEERYHEDMDKEKQKPEIDSII